MMQRVHPRRVSGICQARLFYEIELREVAHPASSTNVSLADSGWPSFEGRLLQLHCVGDPLVSAVVSAHSGEIIGRLPKWGHLYHAGVHLPAQQSRSKHGVSCHTPEP
jgi:hypothetical protein